MEKQTLEQEELCPSCEEGTHDHNDEVFCGCCELGHAGTGKAID